MGHITAGDRIPINLDMSSCTNIICLVGTKLSSFLGYPISNVQAYVYVRRRQDTVSGKNFFVIDLAGFTITTSFNTT